MNPTRLVARAGLLLAAGMLAACNQPAAQSDSQSAAPALETDAQKFGYAIGVDIGESLATVREQVDAEALKAGIDDALAGTVRMDAEERRAVQQAASQRIRQQQLAEQIEKAKAAKAKGEKFLAENAQREGVKTTDSGLQYEVIEQGEGPKPTAEDRVTVHYRGTLIDGTEFDSSYQRGEPITFPLSGVIKGWVEGLQLMPVGSKYRLYIPAELAYGESGAPPRIGPNETLIFEVELLGIEDKDAGNKGDKK